MPLISSQSLPYLTANERFCSSYISEHTFKTRILFRPALFYPHPILLVEVVYVLEEELYSFLCLHITFIYNLLLRTVDRNEDHIVTSIILAVFQEENF